MDEIVKQALVKWPNVPHCYGWLALDTRGRWRVGEKREPLAHSHMVGFINRNYLVDERGCWFFQNGPQRVYVDLDYTPHVWRLCALPEKAGWRLVAHTGDEASEPDAVWLDADGRFLLEARRIGPGEAGIEAKPMIGVLHDHDSVLLADCLCDQSGETLDDPTLEQAIAALAESSGLQPGDSRVVDENGRENGRKSADQRPTLSVRWWTRESEKPLVLPIHAIEPRCVAARFGFNPRPAA